MHPRLAPIPRGGGAREFQLLKPGSADREERPLVGFAADAARREPPTSPVPVGGIVLAGDGPGEHVSLCAVAQA